MFSVSMLFFSFCFLDLSLYWSIIMTANITEPLGDEVLVSANDLAAIKNAGVFVLIGLVIVFGVVGNSLTFVYYGFKEKKTITTLLVTVLALNDLMCSLAMIDHIIIMRYLIRYFSELGCQLTYVINHFLVLNSIILLNPIGMERCLRVCTLNPNYQVTKPKAMFMIGSVAFYSFVMAIRHFVIVGIEEMDIVVSANLTVVGHVCSLRQETQYATAIDVFHIMDIAGFVLTNIFLAFAYGLMAKKIGLVRSKIGAYPIATTAAASHSGNMSLTVEGSNASATGSGTSKSVKLCRRRNNQERKINIMLGTITLSSLLSFLPYFYVVILVKPQASPGAYTYSPLVQAGWRSFMLNSSINPYIIGFFNTNFRTFVINLFPCIRKTQSLNIRAT